MDDPTADPSSRSPAPGSPTRMSIIFPTAILPDVSSHMHDVLSHHSGDLGASVKLAVDVGFFAIWYQLWDGKKYNGRE